MDKPVGSGRKATREKMSLSVEKRQRGEVEAGEGAGRWGGQENLEFKPNPKSLPSEKL